MKKNEPRNLRVSLSEHDQLAFQEKLLYFLAFQTERYTAGDSSSVRVETARELLKSICFCLGVLAEQPDERWESLLKLDLRAEFEKGQHEIEKKIAWGQSIWEGICLSMPELTNDYLAYTLQSIPVFWKQYDYRFFAHEIPCDIDYPLAVPVPDNFHGVDYVNCYLERLLIEMRFLCTCKPENETDVLKLYCRDYKGTFINLFEPIFTNALGLALVGRNGKRLILGNDDLNVLYQLFENNPRQQIEKKLCNAAQKLLDDCGMHHKSCLEYAVTYCKQLAVRIERVKDCGGLGGIFLTRQP